MILVAQGVAEGPLQVLPPSCRYQPSCSAYAITAIQRYGAAARGLDGAEAHCRCHPWGGQAPTRYREDLTQVNDSKNMMLAVVLSALVLLGWSVGQPIDSSPPSNPRSRAVKNGRRHDAAAATGTTGTVLAQSGQDRGLVLASTPRVKIDTPCLQGSINLKGAQIDDLLWLGRTRRSARIRQPVRLLSPLGTHGAYIAGVRLDSAGGAATRPQHHVGGRHGRLRPSGHPVTLTTRDARGMRYQIKIAVDDGYLFTVRQSAINATATPVDVRPIGLVSRGPNRRTRRPGPTMSARSASSAARRTTTSTGRTSTKARYRQFETSPAGSASPINIG